MRLKKYVKLILGAMFLSIAFFVPQSIKGQNVDTITLKENGVEVEVLLPKGVTDIEYISDDFVMLRFNDTSISLKIKQTTVKKQIKFEDSVAASMLEDYPETTIVSAWEEFIVDERTFPAQKMIYDSNGTNTVIDTFCKVNYRYIYTIEARTKGEGNYDIPQQFMHINVHKTKFILNPTVVVIGLGMFITGVLTVGYQIRIRRTWIKTTGIFVDLVRLGKSLNVTISYRLTSGEQMTTISNIGTLAIMFLRKYNFGDTIEIMYNDKKPQKIILIRNKTSYIVGAVFILLGLAYAHLQFFTL